MTQPLAKRQQQQACVVGRPAVESQDSPAVGPALDRPGLRRRWEAAAGMVQEVLGRHPGRDPRLWEEGAILLWLWLVVERMVVSPKEVETAELEKLSKMLVDRRRASLAASRQSSRGHEPAAAAGDAPRLPAHFGEIVRQIYGVNLDASAVAESEATEVRSENEAAGAVQDK